MDKERKNEMLQRIANELVTAGSKLGNELTEEQVVAQLEIGLKALKPQMAEKLLTLANQAVMTAEENHRPLVTEVRPQALECDVVRFQNNKDKWVALVGLLDGYGKILKQVNPDGTKRYDFQFENKRGYKTTVEGLSEKFNPEYWNYAKLISGVLRYRMPLEHVIRLVGSLSLKDESINTWKTGVERALKRYLPGAQDTEIDE